MRGADTSVHAYVSVAAGSSRMRWVRWVISWVRLVSGWFLRLHVPTLHFLRIHTCSSA